MKAGKLPTGTTFLQIVLCDGEHRKTANTIDNAVKNGKVVIKKMIVNSTKYMLAPSENFNELLCCLISNKDILKNIYQDRFKEKLKVNLNWSLLGNPSSIQSLSDENPKIISSKHQARTEFPFSGA